MEMMWQKLFLKTNLIWQEFGAASLLDRGPVGQVYHVALVGTMILLAVLLIAGIIRSVLGPGIADRIIAVNMIGTIVIMLIAVLSVVLDQNYLVDICLIYAMISFLGVVVLCKVYTGVHLRKLHRKANLEAIDENLMYQETHGAEEIHGAEPTLGKEKKEAE